MQQSLHLLIIMLFTNGIYAQAQDSLVKNNDLKRELLEVVVTGQISETTAEN